VWITADAIIIRHGDSGPIRPSYRSRHCMRMRFNELVARKADAMKPDSDDYGSEEPGVAVPADDGTWNRIPGRTGEEVNLDAVPYGFKVTGNAAWDPDTGDFAMFTKEGNAVVAAMVKKARMMVRSRPEAEVIAWIAAEMERIAADTTERAYKRNDRQGTIAGHGEVYDTMVRETIAYALDEAWREAYGHRYDEERLE
jgi:hypothetical protein